MYRCIQSILRFKFTAWQRSKLYMIKNLERYGHNESVWCYVQCRGNHFPSRLTTCANKVGFASLLCFILCKHACGWYENFRGAFTGASAGHDSFVYDGIGILERCPGNIKSLRTSISLEKSSMLFWERIWERIFWR